MYCLCIGVDGVRDLIATQTNYKPNRVRVSWTLPSRGSPTSYQMIVASADIDTTAYQTPYFLTITSPGIYTIQVISLSRHYRSEAVSVQVTVRGGFNNTVYHGTNEGEGPCGETFTVISFIHIPT